MIFPVIAIIERYGLKERSAYLIGKIKNASAAKVLALYMIIRSIASAANIRIGGHVEFVRPLILPMSEAAAEKAKGEPLNEKQRDTLKGMTASIENYGNFLRKSVSCRKWCLIDTGSVSRSRLWRSYDQFCSSSFYTGGHNCPVLKLCAGLAKG